MKKPKIKTSLILVIISLSCFSFIVVGIIIWRRTGCPIRAFVVSLAESMIPTGAPSQRDIIDGVNDENSLPDELLLLMKPAYRLPTYREALENDDIDPPPYVADGGDGR